MFNETTINEETITKTPEAEEHTEVELTEAVTAIKSEPSVTNYLDKSILNIKVVSLDELAKYDEDETATSQIVPPIFENGGFKVSCNLQSETKMLRSY